MSETNNEPKTLTLPSGKTAVIQTGKGKHARMASRVANGDHSLFIPALMAQLVTIDGNTLVAEEFDDMDLNDFMTLSAEFSDVNF
jgi:hypothetical protein